ncbi:hypothetical protein PWP93_18745 [Paraburkholderia sp. A1RI-2L]|uniref:hypothetical protein n=1 Tax=Paraburkholderia sp. A1RI-2L TaxID=3028367 RepID=UPI003B7C82F0
MRDAQQLRNARIGHRPEQPALRVRAAEPSTLPERRRNAALLSRVEHGKQADAQAACQFGVWHRAKQGDLFRRPLEAVMSLAANGLDLERAPLRSDNRWCHANTPCHFAVAKLAEQRDLCGAPFVRRTIPYRWNAEFQPLPVHGRRIGSDACGDLRIGYRSQQRNLFAGPCAGLASAVMTATAIGIAQLART